MGLVPAVIPFGANVTGNIAVTLVLSTITFIITQRKDMSLEDVFGTLDPKKLIGDPVGTLVSKAKQSTDVLVSKGRKELSKLSAKIPLLGEVNAKDLGIDDLPSKMTLW